MEEEEEEEQDEEEANDIFRVDYEISDSDGNSSSPERSPLLYRPADEFNNSDELHLRARMLDPPSHSAASSSSSSSFPRSRPKKRLCLSERINEVENPSSDSSDSGPEMPLPAVLNLGKRREQPQPPSPEFERLFWLKRSVVKPPEERLSDRSAKALASSISDAEELKAFRAEINARYGNSAMAVVFKSEIAVHLKSSLLAAFVSGEGGLEELMLSCWPDVFLRLLTSVYGEIARFDQDSRARQALSREIRIFREKTEERTAFHPAVHRLGLTRSFEQDRLADPEEEALYEYFFAQDERRISQTPVLPLRYPLPHVLRIDPATTAPFVGTCAAFVGSVKSRQKAWRNFLQAGTPSRIGGPPSAAVFEEEGGLVLTEWTADFRKLCTPEMTLTSLEKESVFLRHLAALRFVTQTFLNGGFQVALAASLLALIDPFYSTSNLPTEVRLTKASFLRLLRADTYRYLARCLSWLHADMDLPLACLKKMKTLSDGSLPPQSLGDQGRLALTQLEIFVRYGYYRPARDLFWIWFGRFPSTSWIHEELVLIYCAGALSSVQEELLEIHATKLLHRKCKDRRYRDLDCVRKHLVPLLRSCKTKLLLLKSILLRSLSDLTLREDFRRDCNNALTVCQYYLLVHKRVDSGDVHETNGYYQQLHDRLVWNESADDSPHLRAFLRPFFRFPTSRNGWTSLKENHYETVVLAKLAIRSGLENPRLYSDHLFTLVTGFLFFNFCPEDNRELIQETQTSYAKSTAGRHHRVALLARLLDIYDDFREDGAGSADASVDFSVCRISSSPSGVPDKQQLLTCGRTAARRIDECGIEGLRDALTDFRSCDLSSEEKFCLYLRRRDSFVDVHLDVGFRLMRFSEKL